MVDPALPAPQPAPPPAGSSLFTAGGIVLAIGGLYFGRDIFIPFAVGILLSFALTPLVNWLRRLKLPRVAAALIAVTLAFILIGGLTYVVGRQLVQLANNLPSYQTTITEKIRALQTSAPGGGVVDKVTTTIQDLSKEISGPDKPTEKAAEQAGTSLGTSPTRQEPVTVRLERPQSQPLEIIQTIAGPLLAPLATAGLIVIFVIFILLEQEDLRDRFIKLAGAGDLQKTTQALNDAAARVSRYLLMQLVVNLTYGIPIGIALYFIGVPNAVLWGLLAAVLRFVPYLGPFLAASFPIALAFAVDPGWSMLLWVVGLFLLAELISNNVIEPWLYGSSTGLSSLAIIMAAIFWTTLWGPVGLFLATPLTVCLVVIGRYVPQLEFLGVLLGSDPVLAPEERLYQRLLAGNLEEAVEIAEDYVDENSSREFYDHVGVPALRLAENDRQRSTTDTNYRRLVANTAICVVREIEDHVREKASSSENKNASGEQKAATPTSEKPVLCIAGRTELDRAAAEMLAQVLEENGTGARVLPPIAISEGALAQLDLTGVEVVCLSYLHSQPQVFARYICRRLRRRAPHVKLMVCCWNAPPQGTHTEDMARQMSADAATLSLDVCMNQINAWLAHQDAASDARGSQTPAIIDNEQERIAAMQHLGLSGGHHRSFDNVAKRVAEAFGAPIALVSMITDEQQLMPGAQGLAPDLNTSRQIPREESVCGHVVASDEVVVSEDVTKDPRFTDNPLVLEKGIRFYAGAPLRTSAGLVLGSLCVIDMEPREFSKEERVRLQSMADDLMAELERNSEKHEAESDPTLLSGPRQKQDVTS
ncbi:putative PurR-regulated permease PerM/GAF domain-containing protein [Microvirga lupini]|uniref:Putative PurR-regulated permease PerM/GAF domain-containing protein n=1 Tax=Microvirga lupini TaxID=420324 RepID=A0A7W4VLH1_9HYPH|nr:AI-2E family transporter [Microvirga lupini]MBB3019398.1 putative PurR-regulated permease PerM/GAF domain-containing protein [Microvirga lupini]